jgi:hypothetical protein
VTGRSHRAAHYGARVEEQLRERYDLRPEHDATHDAVARDGTPWELKGAMRRRANGNEGRLTIFEDPHAVLARQGGMYGLAVYRVRGRGVELLETRAVAATELTGRLSWQETGGHRDSRQAKPRWSELL